MMEKSVNAIKRVISVLMALVMATASLVTAHTLITPSQRGERPEPAAPPPEQSFPELPYGFTANLTSPPMYVEAWNKYDEKGEMIIKPIYNDTWMEEGSSAELKAEVYRAGEEYDPDVGHVKYDWKGVARSTCAVDDHDDYAYALADYQAALAAKGYLLFGKGKLKLPCCFYVPKVARHITITISLDYVLKARVRWRVVSAKELYVYQRAEVMVGFFIISRVNDTINFYSEGWYARAYNETYIENAVGLEHEAMNITGKRHLTFTRTYNETRPGREIWVGIWVLFSTLAEIEVDDGLGIEAVSEGVAYLSNIEVRALYSKRAFEYNETGFVLPNNHTAWVWPEGPVMHLVNYSIFYSRSWDAFTFTIDVPDYLGTYTSPVHETGHEDGVLMGSCELRSPNYVESMEAFIKELGSMDMYVALGTLGWGHGRAELHIYSPDWDHEVYHTAMGKAENAFCAHVEMPIECPVLVKVIGPDGTPLENAHVEAYDYCSKEVVATGYTNRYGIVYFLLPHQGYYHFRAHHGSSFGHRLHAVYPLMAAAYVGPCPTMPDYGDLEMGMKRTGAPMSVPYNRVVIRIARRGHERGPGALVVDAVALVPPLPYGLTCVNTTALIYSANRSLAAYCQRASRHLLYSSSGDSDS